MQDLADTVQREVEHIVILHIAADVGHDQRIAVLGLGGIAAGSGATGASSPICAPPRSDGSHGGSQPRLIRVHRLEQIVTGAQMHRLGAYWNRLYAVTKITLHSGLCSSTARAASSPLMPGISISIRIRSASHKK